MSTCRVGRPADSCCTTRPLGSRTLCATVGVTTVPPFAIAA